MAIKKSDFYTFLGASCYQLRGAMYARQYKDYVLFTKARDVKQGMMQELLTGRP